MHNYCFILCIADDCTEYLSPCNTQKGTDMTPSLTGDNATAHIC